MARTTKSTAPPPRASTAGPSRKKLGVSKPPISKEKPTKKGKKKKGAFEILFVKTNRFGQHYGYFSLDEDTQFILAPSAVSRAGGDLEKDSPPVSPRSGDLNKFTMPKPYNFYGVLKFMYPGPSILHKNLVKNGKWSIPLLYPDIDALKKLNVYDEIRGLLGHSGLTFIFHEDPGSYPEVTLEFLCYFNSVIKTTLSGEEKVMYWKFGLGDYVWQIDADVLRDWLRLPRDGVVPIVVDDAAYSFWKEISGKDYTKEKTHKSTCIKVPKWKIIHRFLAGCIFVRTKYGRTVTKLEMMIMSMIDQGRTIDWLWCIAHGLDENKVISAKNKGLGGGSIVTLIAKKLGYTFEGKDAEKVKLDLSKMRHMYILGKGQTWKTGAVSESDDDDDDDGLGAEDVGPRSTAARPDIASTSSAPPMDTKLVLSKIGENTSLLNSLCYYMAEHAQWEQKSLMALAAHAGVSLLPPPKCPFLSRPSRSVPDPLPIPSESVDASVRDVVDSVQILAGEKVVGGDEAALDELGCAIDNIDRARGVISLGRSPSTHSGSAAQDEERRVDLA